MSDTTRPKSTGDKLSADEINQDLPVQMTAGETINGATLPVALYIKDADGEVYACDADDANALEFIGFAVSNSTDGNPITVQTKGIVSGFTGLDAGKKYYIQDDKTIGTSIGTYEVLVGIAISTTQILIKSPNIKTQYVVSDDLKHSSNTEKTLSSTQTPYTKIKEIKINLLSLPAIRVKYDAKAGLANNEFFVRLYKNGVAYGSEHQCCNDLTTNWKTFSQDFSAANLIENDLLQIYGKTNDGGTLYVRNFQLYYTEELREPPVDFTNQDP